MSQIGGVGQGTTLALSGDQTISRIRSVQLPEWLAEAVDFTGLNDLDWMQFLPGSPSDPGSFIAEMFLDSEIAPPTIRLIQTATFTLPIQTAGNAVPATLIGSGFVTSVAHPNAAVAEPLIQAVTFKFDGIGTPPAFTPESLN